MGLNKRMGLGKFIKTLNRFYRREFKRINEEPAFTYSELKKIWFKERVLSYKIDIHSKWSNKVDRFIASYCKNYSFDVNKYFMFPEIINYICVENDAYTTFLNAWKIYIRDKDNISKDRFIRVRYQTLTTEHIQDKKDEKYRSEIFKEIIGDVNEG